MRARIVDISEEQRPFFGIIEVDESYIGAQRVKDKRGRGAFGKTVVFGVHERGGKVYTEIVDDASKSTYKALYGEKWT